MRVALSVWVLVVSFAGFVQADPGDFWPTMVQAEFDPATVPAWVVASGQGTGGNYLYLNLTDFGDETYMYAGGGDWSNYDSDPGPGFEQGYWELTMLEADTGGSLNFMLNMSRQVWVDDGQGGVVQDGDEFLFTASGVGVVTEDGFINWQSGPLAGYMTSHSVPEPGSGVIIMIGAAGAAASARAFRKRR